MNLKNDTYFCFPKHIAWQIFPDGSLLYILNIKEQRFIYFENVSIDIWLNINKGMSLYQITQTISEKYDVEPSVVKIDVIEFINDLISHKVLCTKKEL